MFRRYRRRHTSIVFVIFRLFLSIIIFVALLGGLFSAYKYFSGLDPLKTDPKMAMKSLLELLNQTKIPKEWQKQISERILVQSKDALDFQIKTIPKQPQSTTQNPKFIFRFALFGDSHGDNSSLKKALDQVKRDFPDVRFIIGLGDYTEVGSLDELKKAKNELDSIGFRYFVIPGDHDLWDSRNKSLPPSTNFETVFGPTFQSFIHENFLFLILFNSDNYLGLGANQKNWLSNQLAENKSIKGAFVFLHEPLFHPSSDHFMGRVQEDLKAEAQNLMRQLKEAGVKWVFAADTHFFSEYQDPNTKLGMMTVGAITSQRNLQNPRFAIVYVFEDGSSKVEDVEVR